MKTNTAIVGENTKSLKKRIYAIYINSLNIRKSNPVICTKNYTLKHELFTTGLQGHIKIQK